MVHGYHGTVAKALTRIQCDRGVVVGECTATKHAGQDKMATARLYMYQT